MVKLYDPCLSPAGLFITSRFVQFSLISFGHDRQDGQLSNLVNVVKLLERNQAPSRDEQSFIQLNSTLFCEARINKQFISQDLLVDVQHVVTDYAIMHFNTVASRFQQQNTTLQRLQDQSAITTSRLQDQNITMSLENRQLNAAVPVFSLAALNIRVEYLTFPSLVSDTNERVKGN